MVVELVYNDTRQLHDSSSLGFLKIDTQESIKDYNYNLFIYSVGDIHLVPILLSICKFKTLKFTHRTILT